MKALQIRLVELRIEKEITQKELAAKIGVSASAIGFWENGVNEPKATYLLKLANYFNVSTDYLVGNENEYGIKETCESTPNQPIFSKEEQKLIGDFRQLTYARQKLIRDNIAAMLPQEAESTQKKKG